MRKSILLSFQNNNNNNNNNGNGGSNDTQDNELEQSPINTLSRPFSTPTIKSKSSSTRPTRAAAASATAASSSSSSSGGSLKRKRVNYEEYRMATEKERAAKKKKKANSKKKDDDDSDEDDKKKGGRFGKGFQPPPPLPPLKPQLQLRPTPAQTAFKSQFKIPAYSPAFKYDTTLSYPPLGPRLAPPVPPRPLHDPLEDDAIVLWDPTTDERDQVLAAKKLKDKANAGDTDLDSDSSSSSNGVHKSLASILGLDIKNNNDGVKKVPVVVDPRLSKILRPHQVEGVRFLFKCSNEMIQDGAWGGIMADAMGLGKTLQCISLLWTLLKQSPIPGKPSIEKAIVACPASLVKNWAAEFDKWLGKGTINALTFTDGGSAADKQRNLRHWASVHGRQITHPVLISSYEGLSKIVQDIGNSEIGLLLCDEGHRLKNPESNTYVSINTLNCKRRVLLTGTPIQNDLTEYFALLNFANPGLLGTRAEFRKNFENAICRGRDASSTDKQQEVGATKMKELHLLCNKFIIRRTNELLTKYLPKKYEHVVFCTLSPFQIALYNLFLKSDAAKRVMRDKDTGGNALNAIGTLKKICNHPDLLDWDKELPEAAGGDVFPEGYNPKDSRRVFDPAVSGKMAVVARFLRQIKETSQDKIVLISNSTQVLDLMVKLCLQKKYGYFRLDGKDPVKRRQKLVDSFNNPQSKEFIFLLSSKAGGCGINLVGANRLILFDPDWNPAADQQALARVWRDGQTKTCFVYRFLGTGSIEEKIFQRQAQKQQLSSCIVDENEDEVRHFSRDQLKDLFRPKFSVASDTHDTFKCKRCVDGRQRMKAPAMLYGDTSTWNHFSEQCLPNIHDDLLRAESGLGSISATFQFVTTN